MQSSITPFDLSIRHHIYTYFAEHCADPSVVDLSNLLGVAQDDVRASFHTLHQHHMIFLQPGSASIRMANPFSAVPTLFKVTSGQKQWWANCAWDALGIPATLKIDATISAAYPDGTDTVEFHVRGGSADGKGHVVYFPLPCRQWYDDLAFT